MAKHPKFVDTTTFSTWLREQGTAEKIISAALSDVNLLVPFLIASIDKDTFIELVNARRYETGFEKEDSFWNEVSIPLIIKWAEEETKLFKNSKEEEKRKKH